MRLQSQMTCAAGRAPSHVKSSVDLNLLPYDNCFLTTTTLQEHSGQGKAKKLVTCTQLSSPIRHHTGGTMMWRGLIPHACLLQSPNLHCDLHTVYLKHQPGSRHWSVSGGQGVLLVQGGVVLPHGNTAVELEVDGIQVPGLGDRGRRWGWLNQLLGHIGPAGRCSCLR